MGNSYIKRGRHLLLLLVAAERAWAQAMDLQRQVEAKPTPHLRLKLVRRLGKAARHGSELARCEVCFQIGNMIALCW